jgi:murein DD-endopeptidase MepM/ murein hydrolase activator NlpD
MTRNRPSVAAGAAGAALLIVLAAGCTTEADEPAGTTPASTTAASSTSTVTVPTTTATTGAATTTTVEPPPGKNPICLKRAHFGDPAESEYVLPYAVGDAYYLMQSYCASGATASHGDQLAYDWYMPIGSEVAAARGGWVVLMRESNPDNGRGYTMENYVYIEHADGTIAFYAHLMQHGVDVEVGQWVDQGERIGASGNSGSTRDTPHLHFGVYRDWPQYEEMAVPVNFRNTDGELDTLGGLLVNRLYEALAWEE